MHSKEELNKAEEANATSSAVDNPNTNGGLGTVAEGDSYRSRSPGDVESTAGQTAQDEVDEDEETPQLTLWTALGLLFFVTVVSISTSRV